MSDMNDQVHVDACGYSCPQPMLMASDAIRDAGEDAEVLVEVSDAASRDSVLRLAQKLGRSCACSETTDGFRIMIHRRQK